MGTKLAGDGNENVLNLDYSNDLKTTKIPQITELYILNR
jgi:hypothetical protein